MSIAKRTIESRWGNFDYWFERIDDTYTRHIFEGPREAVVVAVGDRLKGTTVMYEYMFTVSDMGPHPDPQKARCNWLRAECTSSNYAGD